MIRFDPDPNAATETPRWENWQRAFSELRPLTGTLWIVSPFITAVPEHTELKGAQVLTTLDARKIATDSTSLAVLRHFQAQGADVRILNTLHAKAYLKRTGTGATGFTGSANLTVRADRQNKEVMTGPQDLNSGFLTQLDLHWDDARPLTAELIAQVQKDADRLCDNARAQAQVEEDVLVFSVTATMFRGSYQLTEELIGVPEAEHTRGFRPARVDYVPAVAQRSGSDLIVGRLQQARNGKYSRALPLPGHRRLYAVALKDAGAFRDALRNLDTELRQTMYELRDRQRQVWRDDFLTRLEQAIRVYNRAGPEVIQNVVAKGTKKFEDRLSRTQISVQFTEFLPLKGAGGDAYQKVFRAVRENQPLEMDDETEVFS